MAHPYLKHLAVLFVLGCGTSAPTQTLTVHSPAPKPSTSSATSPPPIWSAAEDGKLAEVNALIAQGADVDAPAHPYGSPLMAALEFEHEDVVRALVAAGAKIDPSAMALAARSGLHSLFPLFVAKGLSAKWHSPEGWTALHAAAKYGHTETVKALLALGADVDAVQDDGRTPLVEAVTNDKVDAARVLLDAHARLDVKTRYGESPLHWAVYATRAESTEYFPHDGPPFRGRPEEATDAKIVELLVSRKAPLDAADNPGNTPLHEAAVVQAPLAARILVKHGANTTIRNAEGKTAADIARERGHASVSRAIAGN